MLLVSDKLHVLDDMSNSKEAGAVLSAPAAWDCCIGLCRVKLFDRACPLATPMCVFYVRHAH